MLVRKIKLSNFMSHTSSTLTFPETGITLVTGANGSGKSTIAEAVAVAAWGKSLRGSLPWVVGKTSETYIEATTGSKKISISRRRSENEKVSLDWQPASTTYATLTKSQIALSSRVGDFDTWRRCSVFSSQDASHFTLSSDSERKRLLENLLGLDEFDNALSVCRGDKKLLVSEISSLSKKVSDLSIGVSLKKEAIEDNKLTLTKIITVGTEIISEDTLGKIRQTIDAKNHISVRAREDLENASTARVELLAVETNCITRLETARFSNCPTCEQPISKEYSKKITEEVESGISKLRSSLNKNSTIYNKISIDIRNLEEETRGLEISLSAKAALFSEQSNKEGIKSHLEEIIAKTKQAVKDYTAEKDILGEQIDSLEKKLFILENTEIVLGTKGVRAHILRSALNALELTTNYWLSQISNSEISIEINPYTEKKSGGQNEAIALIVNGVAGGTGYKGCSGGQRRRIDVALLLGLAELAKASNQHSSGTVFFDEVFDSLDQEGIQAVSSVIDDIAKTRNVVVISHSEQLAEQLNASAHYHIDSGVII